MLGKESDGIRERLARNQKMFGHESEMVDKESENILQGITWEHLAMNKNVWLGIRGFGL